MPKVQFGLKNVHIAKITENNGAVTYGTPFALPGAVSLSLSPSGDENVFYADDIRYYVIAGNGSYDGNMVIAMVTDDFAKDILGYQEDATAHVLAESGDIQPSKFAMTFEIQNDEDARRYVLYNVSVSRADLSANTKEESVEVQTATLDISCSGAIDTGLVRAYTTEEAPAATHEGWNTSIFVPTL